MYRKRPSFHGSYKEVNFCFTILGKLSIDLRIRLRHSIKRDLPHYQLKKIDLSVELTLETGSNYKVTFYGKTFQHFYTRVPQHMRISKDLQCYIKTPQKTINSLQYLTIYYSVIVPKTLMTLTF